MVMESLFASQTVFVVAKMVGTCFIPPFVIVFEKNNEIVLKIRSTSMTIGKQKSLLSSMLEPLRDTNLALLSRIYSYDSYDPQCFTFARSAHVESF
jgi:hypothetical protein